MRVSSPGPDHSVSFPSKGAVLDHGVPVANDHSTLTDVGGKHVWLHRDKHHFEGDRVVMPYHHAVDMGLTDAEDKEDTHVDKKEPAQPITKLQPGQSGHKAEDKPDENKNAPKPIASSKTV
jgi:hypothetical protein